MDVLDNPNSYKKLCDNLDTLFNQSLSQNSKNDRSVDLSISNNLEDYKTLTNNRIEKLFKLFEINSQNDKNDKEVLDQIKKELDNYKSLNDGRIDKLAKLFLLLNKNS